MSNRQKSSQDLSVIAQAIRKLAVPIKTLKLDPRNARLHPERNIEAIKSSLQSFGQQRPIIIDKSNVVIAGNGLLTAAKSLGWKTIAAIRTELSGDQLRAFAIADNRTGELSTWDEAELLRQLEQLEAGQVDSATLGFSADELTELSKSLESAIADADDAGGDEDPGHADHPKADVQFALGGYRWTITRKKYDAWLEKLRQKSGFDEASVIAELKARLGL